MPKSNANEFLLHDDVLELHAALKRLSSWAAYWYARDAVRAARRLGLVE